jgi:hypothetical protein
MIDAMKMALAALETCDVDYDYDENPYNTFDAEDVSEAIEALRQAIEQAERKPVKSFSGGVPWYATDAPKHEDDDIQEYKKPWVGLTDEEIAQTVGSPLDEVYLADFCRVIAKLKERNT